MSPGEFCLKCERAMTSACGECEEYSAFQLGSFDMRKSDELTRRAKLVYIVVTVSQEKEQNGSRTARTPLRM